jgi:hypothetical protein
LSIQSSDGVGTSGEGTTVCQSRQTVKARLRGVVTRSLRAVRSTFDRLWVGRTITEHTRREG